VSIIFAGSLAMTVRNSHSRPVIEGRVVGRRIKLERAVEMSTPHAIALLRRRCAQYK
jgi:hypothetical protein